VETGRLSCAGPGRSGGAVRVRRAPAILPTGRARSTGEHPWSSGSSQPAAATVP